MFIMMQSGSFEIEKVLIEQINDCCHCNINNTTTTATLPVETSVVTSKEAAVTDRVDDVDEEVLTPAQSPVDVDNVM